MAKNEFENIFAYYYDLSFEETLLRHSTKPNCKDFGKSDMKKWFLEKDFLEVLEEKVLTKELSLSEVVELILCDLYLL